MVSIGFAARHLFDLLGIHYLGLNTHLFQWPFRPLRQFLFGPLKPPMGGGLWNRTGDPRQRIG
jgi:hypothetical protein